MNTQIAKLLIEKFDLTPSEHDYIISIDKEAFIQERVYKANELLSQLYIIKMNELSAKSTDQSTKTMTTLTWVLAIAAGIQAIATGVQAYASFVN
jgi:phage terminase small subunit